MEIVEVGIKLNNDLSYYDNILKNKGLYNDFNVEKHDIYYTNKDLDNLSENEIKNSCIRLRSCNNSSFKVQNNLVNEININEVPIKKLTKYEKNYQNLDIEKYLILLNMIIIIIRRV